MDKWAVFQTIPREAWQHEAHPTGGSALARLPTEWVREYFQEAYAHVSGSVDPATGVFTIYLFQRVDGASEITVLSRQSPGEYYDFVWDAGDVAAGNPKHIPRLSSQTGARAGTATASASAGERTIRIFSADIDEEIEFSLQSLAIVAGQSRQEKALQTLPWKRLLVWYARLQSLDSQAFGRVPKPVQQLLRQRGFEAAVEALQWTDVEGWQRQGVLPQELAWIFPQDAQPLAESIRLQQQLANDSRRQSSAWTSWLTGPSYMPEIPKLLCGVDARALDLADLQAFMTMGALREVHGFVEREMQKLFARRPALQTLSQLPQGQNQIQQDAEVQMINAHPQAAKEQQELLQMQYRRMGNYTFDMQLAQAKQQAEVMRQFGVPSPFLEDPLPPWKVYRHFAI